HRGVSFTSTAGTADEFGATVADPSQRVDLPDARHTTSTDTTRDQPRVQSGMVNTSESAAMKGVRRGGRFESEASHAALAANEHDFVLLMEDRAPPRSVIRLLGSTSG